MNKKRYYVEYFNGDEWINDSFETADGVLSYRAARLGQHFKVIYGEKLEFVAKHPVITYKLVSEEG